MRKQHLIFIIIALLVMVSLACTRSASSGPVPTVTSADDPIESVFSQSATQQALQTAEAKAPEEVATPVEVVTPAVQPAVEEEPEEDTRDEENEQAANNFDPTVPSSYTLQKGEFPFCLARRFNIDVGALLSANGLTLQSVVSPGQTLTIPQNAAAFTNGPRSLLTHPSEYTVAAGDTLHSIACKYGDVYPEEIALANGKGENYTPSAGETLQIP